MRHLLGAAVVAVLLAVATTAMTQSAPPVPDTAPPAKPATTEPLQLSKRMACRASAQALQGQDRRDRMQLCMAQARLDCLKQAVDQKIIGPQRREFVRNCTQ